MKTKKVAKVFKGSTEQATVKLGYDKNRRFLCVICKPHKSIAGPWSYKQHLITQHDRTPKQAGLARRKAAK